MGGSCFLSPVGAGVGVGRAAFVVPDGLPTGGYGPGSPKGRAGSHPLQIRAIAARGEDGRTVVLVVGDIHSGTGLLHDQVCARLGAHGLGPEQIVLAGTHTHTGPGRIYGNSLYDGFAGGFLAGTPIQEAARLVVDAIVSAVRGALGSIAPGATVAPFAVTIRGIARNRSVVAFPKAARIPWTTTGPGRDTTGNLMDRLVDGRLRGLVFRRADGTVCAVHALIACHNTAMGAEPVWDPDFVGRAMTLAEGALGNAVVNLALAGAGDQSPLPADALRDPSLAKNHQGEKLANRRAKALAETLVAAVRATGAGGRLTVATRLSWWEPGKSGDLAKWRFGAATLAGAEDGRSPFAKMGLVHEGQKRHQPLPPDAPLADQLQFPKSPAGAGGLFGKIVFAIGNFNPAHAHPLHQVDIGPTTLVTLPGEPTVLTAWTLEQAVSQRAGRTVLVQGYTGDYAGYFTTPEEFASQQYEGASTLYGRNTVPRLVREHVALRDSAANQTVAKPEIPESGELEAAGVAPAVGETEAWQVGGSVVVLALTAAADVPLALDGRRPEAHDSVETPWGILQLGRWTAPDSGLEAAALPLVSVGGVQVPAVVRPWGG